MDAIFNEFLQELQRRQENKQLMRQLRDASNPFNTPAKNFKKMFLFTRQLAHDFFMQIREFLDNAQRVTRIPSIIQFFVALHFYAHGSYQKSIGRDRDCSLSQSSVSRCLHRVTTIIVDNFAWKFIKFPQTPEEIASVKNRFFELFGFPGVIGAIDGTHISIFPPAFGAIPPSVVYLNRKNFHSINTQIICDADLKILNINSRFPGSVHDSAIWQRSDIFAHLRNNYFNGDRTSWLLGDSGYPPQPFLLTPIIGANEETPEGRYTHTHCRARNTVERCIGVLKGTFRCLLKDRTLHYKPEFAAQIIIACATLHNVLRMGNVEYDEEHYDDDDDDVDDVLEFMDLHAEGVNIRNNVIRNHFN